MTDLAAAVDVAHALGLADENELGDARTARVGPLLAKLSREFRREAGRQFTPGRTKVRLLTVDSRITLPDGLGVGGEVHAVTIDGEPVEFTVDDDEVILSKRRLGGQVCVVGTGVRVKLDYTHNEPVPDEVKAAIAAMAARYLTVDPTSAVAQSTYLASEHFQQRFADWVSASVKLTQEDCEFARSYKSSPATVIVLR